MNHKVTLFLLFMLFLNLVLGQQSLTLGNGMHTSRYVPAYVSSYGSHTEFLYSFSNLGNMNNCAITGLVFYAADENSWPYPCSVYLEEVSNSSYSDYDRQFLISNAAQQVWRGFCTVEDSVWVLVFDRPFVYHGGNLMVHLQYEYSGETRTQFRFYGDSTSNFTSLYSSSTMNYGGNVVMFRPKATFFYSNTFDMQCSAPSEPIVSALSHSGFSVSWTPGGDESQWSVFLDGQLVAVTDSMSYTFTNLMSDRAYKVGIRAVCGESNVSVVTPAMVRTLREPLSENEYPYIDDFESLNASNSTALGSFWRRINGYAHKGHYPRPTTVDAHSGTKSLFFLAGPHYQPEYAVMPGVLSPGSLTLNFWARQEHYADTRITVGLMSSPLDTSTFVPVAVLAATDGNWNNYDVSFEEFAGREGLSYIALRVSSLTGRDRNVYVDDVILSRGQTCQTPAGLRVARTGAEEVLLRWNGTSDNSLYRVSYISLSDLQTSSDAWYSITTDADSLLLTNLLVNTEYVCRIQKVCGNTYSVMNQISFSTECASIMGIQLPYEENFESYPMTDSLNINPCWMRYSVVDGSPVFDTLPYLSQNSPHSGMRGLKMCDSNYLMTASYVVLPRFEYSPSNLMFSCWARSEGNPNTAVLSVGVIYNPNDPFTFTPFKTVSGISNEYTNIEAGIPEGLDGGRIAVRCYSSEGKVFLDDIRIIQRPQCPPVEDVTTGVVTVNSAELMWNDISNMGLYNVTYGPTAGGETDTVAVSGSMETTLLNLMPATEYIATVYTNCNTQSDGRSVTFKTKCQELPVSELPFVSDFDLSWENLHCWTVRLYDGNYWQSVSPQSILSMEYAHSIPYALVMRSGCSYANGEPTHNFYSSTVVSLPAIAGPISDTKVSFWYRSIPNTTFLDVGVCDNPDDTSGFVLLRTILPQDNQWHEYEVPLSHYDGDGHYITFIQRSSGRYWYITESYLDDIVVDVLDGCSQPSGVAVSGLGPDSAIVVWAAGDNPGTYCVKWSETDSAVVSGVATYTITGLQPDMEYTVGVSKLCDGTYTSYGNLTFRTECTPIAHSSLPWMDTFEDYADNQDTLPCYEFLNRFILGSYQYPLVRQYIPSGVLPGSTKSLCILNSSEIMPIVVLPPFEDSPENLKLSFYASFSGNLGEGTIEVGVVDNSLDPASFQVMDVFSPSYEFQQFETTFSGHQSGRIALRTTSVRAYLFYIDNIKVDTLNGCSRPYALNVDNISQTSAEISISSADNPIGYMLYWSSPTISDSVQIAYNSHTLNGLVAGTTYAIGVRALCADNSQSLVRTAMFNTECAEVGSLPFRMDFDSVESVFDGEFPNCWTRYFQAVYGAELLDASDCVNVSASGSDKILSLTSYNNSNVYGSAVVALPRFATTFDSLKFSFRYRFTSGVNRMEVGVLSEENESEVFVPFDVIEGQSSALWTGYFKDLSGSAVPPGRLALRYSSVSTNSVGRLQVDDFLVDYNQTCDRPQNAAVTVYDTYARVTIYDPYSTQNYLLVVSDVSNVDSLLWQTDSDTLYGLQPNTEYSLAITTLCDGDFDTEPFRTTFKTTCQTITHDDLPYIFTFDNYISNSYFQDPCWKMYKFERQGNIYAYMYGNQRRGLVGRSVYVTSVGQGNSLWLVSPVFDSVNDLEIAFWTYALSEEHITVGPISYPDDTTTFTPMATVVHTDSAAWQEHRVSLAGGRRGAKYFAFRFGLAANRFVVVDDVVVAPVATCPRAQSVSISEVTSRSALCTITDTTLVDYYRIVLSRHGYPDTVIETYDRVNLLSGLAPASNYTVYASTDCGDGYSTLPVIASFVTSCDVLSHSDLPFLENFDDYIAGEGISPCWDVIEASPSVVTPDASYNYGPSNGNSLKVSNSCNGFQGTYVVLPEFDSINDLLLTFGIRQYYYSESTVNVSVGVITDIDDIGTYTPLEDCPYVVANGTWQYCEVAFSNYNIPPSARIAIYVCGGTVFLDSIGLDLNVGCTKPGNLVVSDIGTTEATITFSDNNATGHYRLFVNDFMMDIYDTTYHLTGLFAATQYSLAVATVCPNRVTQYVYADFCTQMCDGGTTAVVAPVQNGASRTTYYPVNTAYRYSLSQVIVDADELVGAMDISAIVLNVAGNNPVTKADQVDIYFQTTTQSVFGEQAAPTPLNDTAELVYRGSLNLTPGINFVALDGVYRYNGTDNLLVTFVRNQGQYSNNISYFKVYGIGDENTRKTLYYQSDIGPIDAWNIQDLLGTTTVNARPEMHLISCGTGCQRPRFLMVDSVGMRDVAISWTGVTSDYYVSIKKAGSNEWSDEMMLSANNCALGNLDPGTAYEARVRAICGDNVPSGYAYCHFTTVNIPAPTGLRLVDSTFTDATFEWTSDTLHSSWVLHVWNNSFNREYAAETNPFTVDGLSYQKRYNVAVKGVYAGGITESGYSDTISFSTAMCQPVTGVAAAAVDSRAIAVSWDDVGAGRYLVDYGFGGHGAGTGRVVVADDTNGCIITELKPDTTYWIYVRAVCLPGVYGDWSEPVEVRTPQEESILVPDSLHLAVHPNPTSGALTITAVVPRHTTLDVTVVDLSGRPLISETMVCEGECSTTIDVSSLAKGAYFARISGENVSAVRKFVVK